MPLSIALVGMPGSGKSTIGRHLARHIGRRFVDSDHEIEREVGQPIRVFFEQQGEAVFRDLEQATIARLAAEPDLVLATGGGACIRPANRQVLAGQTIVLYLRSSPEDLFRRLRHDTQRPLLQVADPLKRLRELFRERDPHYRATARFVIETGRPSVPTLVNMILMQLELAGILDPQSPRQVPPPSGRVRSDPGAPPPAGPVASARDPQPPAAGPGSGESGSLPPR